MSEKTYYDIRDISYLFGVSDKTVRRWVEAGLPYHLARPRGVDKYYFKLWEVELWAQKNRGAYKHVKRYFKEKHKRG